MSDRCKVVSCCRRLSCIFYSTFMQHNIVDASNIIACITIRDHPALTGHLVQMVNKNIDEKHASLDPLPDDSDEDVRRKAHEKQKLEHWSKQWCPKGKTAGLSAARSPDGRIISDPGEVSKTFCD